MHDQGGHFFIVADVRVRFRFPVGTLVCRVFEVQQLWKPLLQGIRVASEYRMFSLSG